MRPHPWTIVVGLASIAGFVFAAVSTHDFMMHLDRQVHGIHCSFLPGLVAPDASGSSGCHVTMMSPYSSFLRDRFWGGIPITVPAMSMFAFILFWVKSLVLHRRQESPKATGFLALVSIVPVVASLIMGYIAATELDTACNICIGIYTSSALIFVGSVALWLRAKKEAQALEQTPSLPGAAVGTAAVIGLAFVLVPVVTYAAVAPNFDRFVGACGTLSHPADPNQSLFSLRSSGSGISVVEILDPMCPACRAFEERFDKSSVSHEVSRSALLFPLDNECNWMVTSAIHPGACAVSEAILCAGGRGEQVLDWAFAQQPLLRQAAGQGGAAVRRLIENQFPDLRGCIDSAGVKAKLNRALRWAVKNQLPVLTPQLYVNGAKLCDEDTDLGMEYMLKQLVAHQSTRGSHGP